LDDQPAAALRAPEVPSPPDAAAAGLTRLVDRMRRQQRIGRGPEVPAAQPVAEVAARAPDPQRLLAAKAELAALVEREIGTEGTDPSQPWIAAEAVVEGGVPIGELHRTIRFAQNKARAGLARRGLAGCFYGSFIRVCARHGFHWPKRPKPR